MKAAVTTQISVNAPSLSPCPIDDKIRRRQDSGYHSPPFGSSFVWPAPSTNCPPPNPNAYPGNFSKIKTHGKNPAIPDLPDFEIGVWTGVPGSEGAHQARRSGVPEGYTRQLRGAKWLELQNGKAENPPVTTSNTPNSASTASLSQAFSLCRINPSLQQASLSQQEIPPEYKDFPKNFRSQRIHSALTKAQRNSNSLPPLPPKKPDDNRAQAGSHSGLGATKGAPSVPKSNYRNGMVAKKSIDHCVLCVKNGEPKAFANSHTLRDMMGLVTCPVLFRFVCPHCGATGSHAHTESYCPSRPTHVPGSLTRIKPVRNACGRRIAATKGAANR